MARLPSAVCTALSLAHPCAHLAIRHLCLRPERLRRGAEAAGAGCVFNLHYRHSSIPLLFSLASPRSCCPPRARCGRSARRRAALRAAPRVASSEAGLAARRSAAQAPHRSQRTAVSAPATASPPRSAAGASSTTAQRQVRRSRRSEPRETRAEVTATVQRVHVQYNVTRTGICSQLGAWGYY